MYENLKHILGVFSEKLAEQLASPVHHYCPLVGRKRRPWLTQELQKSIVGEESWKSLDFLLGRVVMVCEDSR